MKKTLTFAVALLTAGALSLWAGFAQAHDGPHGPRVLADVRDATVMGTEVTFDLMVTGLETGHALTITRLTTEGAETAPLSAPVPVAFARDVLIPVRLRFGAAPPGIFTLTIDFGDAGQGSVVVIPDPAASRNAQKNEER